MECCASLSVILIAIWIIFLISKAFNPKSRSLPPAPPPPPPPRVYRPAPVSQSSNDVQKASIVPSPPRPSPAVAESRPLEVQPTPTVENAKHMQDLIEKVIHPWIHAKMNEQNLPAIAEQMVKPRSSDQRLVVQDVDLRKFKFNGFSLSNITFINCCLIGVDLSEAQLDHFLFKDCLLTRANFNGAKIMNSYFFGCDFSEASFRQAALQNNQFNRVDLCQADFTSARLQRCHFLNSAKSRAVNLYFESAS